MRKRILVLLLSLMLLACISVGMTGCDAINGLFGGDEEHTHAWVEATCTEPKHCTGCDATEGEALGHTWVDATCLEAKHCSKCDATEGEASGHTWVDANCLEAKHCSVCSTKEGDPLGHTGGSATCIALAKCERCNNEYGELGQHEWVGADCTSARHCSLCNLSDGVALGHTGGNATCTALAECERCGEEYGDLATHTWEDATCSAAKYCSVCNETDGAALGHTGGSATCTALAECERCGEEYGNLAAHTWEDATCTAAKYCSACNTTDGAALGHTGGSATCAALAECERCGEEYGNLAAHTWTAADCTSARYCSECSLTDGEPLGHGGGKATCTALAECERCGEEYGELKAHVIVEATCFEAKYCRNCSYTEGEALGHDWTEWSSENGVHTRTCKNDATHTETGECTGGSATCLKPAVCDTCNSEYGTAKGHTFGEWETVSEATCTAAGEKKQSCECGEEKTDIIPALGHDYSDVVVEATCTAKGSITSTCAECSDVKIVYTDPKGHSWNIEAPTCEEGQECSVCHETVKALGHNYELVDTEPATCTATAVEKYACSVCSATYTVNVGDMLDHDTTGATPTLVIVDGETCLYIQKYVCNDCGAEVEGKEVTQHEFTAVITTAATCKDTGIKTRTCKLCEHSETEVIPVDDVTGHTWTEGELVGNVRTDVCSICNSEKTVTVLTGETNINDLKDTEVSVGDANITIDEDTVNGIGDKDVTISADTLTDEDKSDLKLDDDQLAQVGNNEIYNFTINAGEENITSFDGYITVTLPYTLEEGEDVDNIAVWYISEDGTLESIKATYNNGYVTFKTNHFSYYTVTRLTPKQRCELYGHNYSSKTSAATCTQDGYTLNFCIRCGHSEKTDIVKAAGHNYTVNTTPATCTEDGINTYTCTECAHSYNAKIPAINHAWNENERTDATCSSTGHVKYICGNDGCGEEYTEILPEASHNLEGHHVEATCMVGGHTLYECMNDGCGYSVVDDIEAPLGHEYTAEFNWSDKYDKATMVVRCKHDKNNDHSMSYDNTDISTKYVLPSCASKGQIEFVARITHNGEIYEDVKFIPYADSYSHTYSKTLTADETGHWYECTVCGDKKDFSKHAYGEAAVTKLPTCAESGLLEYTCSCGYVHEANSPATGIHNYVGGICKDCGIEESLCDHTSFSYKMLDLGQYGICLGDVLYRTCDCGEVCEIIDIESIMDGDKCNFEDNAVNDQGTTPDGMPWMSAESICSTCGVKIYIYAYVNMDGCVMQAVYNITLTHPDGTTLGDFSYIMDADENHQGTEEKLYINQYGACSEYIMVEKCANCGLIIDLGDGIADGCELGYEENEFTDANGVIHYQNIMACKNCEFKIIVEYTVESISIAPCYIVEKAMAYFCYGDNIFITVNGYEEIEIEHDYVYDLEFNGVGCADGYHGTKICSKCGDASNVEGKYHNTEYISVDLTELGFCGGYISAEICKYCHTASYIGNMSISCSVAEKEPDYVQYTDVNGVVHTIGQITCPDCGLTFIVDSYTLENGCVTSNIANITIKNGDDVLLDMMQVYTSGYHDYVYEYTFNGTSCDDGYHIKSVCSECGDTKEYDGYGHESIGMGVNLREYGMCDGYLQCSECTICGKKEIHGIDAYSCQWSEPVIDAEGYAVSTCTVCGAEYKYLYSETDRNGCHISSYQHHIYSIKGEILCEYEGNYSQSNHNYGEEILVFNNGVDCEDGYFVTKTCLDCGYEYEMHGYGHDHEYSRIEFSEYGLCWGYIEVGECTVCGHINSYEYSECYWTVMTELEDGYTVEKCRNCGLERLTIENIGDKNENCEFSVYMSRIYRLNGEEIFEYEIDEIRTQHNYEITAGMNGSSCEAGYTLYYYCPDCGASHSEGEYTHHETKYVYQNLSELGMCGGYMYRYDCTRCGYTDFGDINFYCSWENLGTDENGYSVYKCKSCGAELHEFISKTDKDEKCCYVETHMYIVYLNGEEIINSNTTIYREEHNYERTFEFDGGIEDCENGVSVITRCLDCGYKYSDYNTYHYEYTTEEFDLSDYSTCGGSFSIVECPCGKYSSIYYDFRCDTHNYSEYTDEEGRRHCVDVMTCSMCGLRFQNDYYNIYDYDNCVNVRVGYIVINIDDQLVTNYNYSLSSESHSYENITGEFVNGSSSCENGVYITYTCHCGDSYRSYTSWHEYVLEERYDLTLPEHGSAVCTGELVVWSCLCGRQSKVELVSDCDFGTCGIDCWVDDALTSDNYAFYSSGNTWGYAYNHYWIQTCAVTDPVSCAYKMRVAEYWAKEEGSCIAERYIVYQLGFNEETGTYLKEIKIKTGETKAHHSYTVTELCEEYENGYTKLSGVSCVCKNCGSTYYSINEYSETGKHTYYTREFVNTLSIGNQMWKETYDYNDNGETEYHVYQYITQEGREYLYEVTYVSYNNHMYSLTEKQIDGDYWYLYEYTYNFDNGCRRTVHYTNSNGEDRTYEEDCHITYGNTTLYPTCTQDGIRTWECDVCDYSYDETRTPYGHSWNYVCDGYYYCSRCGLENINGADGSVIFEDYTSEYGNGENYVVGYYSRTWVSFLYNVSLILKTPLENGDDMIILPEIVISECTDIRGVWFSKSEVAAAAEALGYTSDMYDIRLAFVPVGADGTLDYAITFTNDPVIEAGSSITDAGRYEFAYNTDTEQSFTFTPAESGEWILLIYGDLDQGIYVEGTSGSSWGQYWGCSQLSFYFEAGETYTITLYIYEGIDYANSILTFIKV